MSERLVWIDCEMTGLDLGADALVEVAALVTDFDLNVLGAGIDIIIKPPRRGAGADGRLRAADARDVRAARGARQGHHAARRRGAGARLRAGPVRAAQPAAAGGQLGGDRPVVPGAGHADAGHVPALPDRRRVLDQGAVAALVPAGLLPGAGQARQPPRPGRHPGEHRGAALLPRHRLRARAGPDSDAAREAAPSATAARSPASARRGRPRRHRRRTRPPIPQQRPPPLRLLRLRRSGAAWWV